MATVMAVAILQENDYPDEGTIMTVDMDSPQVPRLSDDLLEMEILRIVHEFGTVFSKIPGKMNLAEYAIRTGDSAPIRAPTYHIPIAYTDNVHEELITLQELGIMSPSKSHWASTLVAMRKKDGKFGYVAIIDTTSMQSHNVTYM